MRLMESELSYSSNYSPIIVKPATIRTVLSLPVSHNWAVHKLDVKNAFLHGTLEETIYCAQPFGFIYSSKFDHV